MAKRGKGQKSKKTCRTCGQRYKENVASSFSCCLGKVWSKILTVHPSPQLIDYCMEGKNQWKISTSSKLPPGGKDSLTLSTLSGEIEQEILLFLQRITRNRVSRVPMDGHCTSPWSIRASDLTSPKSLLQCFTEKARSFISLTTVTSASIGGILHSLLDAGCESGGDLGPNWGVAKSKVTTIDAGELNMFVHGSCDAVYQSQFPVELKTVDDMSKVDSSKVRAWLLQIAVYQCLYSKSKAILIIICRKTYELRAYEVHPGNVDHAVAAWRLWLSQQPLLKECVALSRPYNEALIDQRSRVLTGDDNSSKLFMDLLARSIPVFVQHTTLSLQQVRPYLMAAEMTIASQLYARASKYYKTLKSSVGVTSCKLYDASIVALQLLKQESEREVTRNADTISTHGLELERQLQSQDDHGISGDSTYNTDETVNRCKEASRCFSDAICLYSSLFGQQANQVKSLVKKRRDIKMKLKKIGMDLELTIADDDFHEGQLFEEDLSGSDQYNGPEEKDEDVLVMDYTYNTPILVDDISVGVSGLGLA